MSIARGAEEGERRGGAHKRRHGPESGRGFNIDGTRKRATTEFTKASRFFRVSKSGETVVYTRVEHSKTERTSFTKKHHGVDHFLSRGVLIYIATTTKPKLACHRITGESKEMANTEELHHLAGHRHASIHREMMGKCRPISVR